jgi:hypothetical protein
MADRLRYVTGDRVDTWTDPNGRLAVGRVTPRQLPAGDWPDRANVDDRALVFLAGALRGGDLASGGLGALRSARGSFCAARWEPASHRLALAVDRRASRPLAYARVGSRLYFAPEVKALLAAPGFDKALDEAAIGLFLGAGYTLAHQTLFSGARRLGGGEVLVVEPGRVAVEPYWHYRLSERGDGAREAELAEELATLVRRAVELELGDPERAVVFLSGGVDSRSIASIAQEVSKRRGTALATVTWAAPNARRGSDREIAQRVAEALGTRHVFVERQVRGYGQRLAGVTYLLDGLTDIAAYHPHEHAVMRDLAARGVLAVLRGDECFGWEKSVGSLEEAWLSLNLRSPRRLRHLGAVVRPEVLARLSGAAEAALADASRAVEGEHPDNAKDLLYFRHRLQGYLGSAAYLKQVILDHRAPLVDDALLAFNARVPARLRAEKLLFCRTAARLSPELFRIPLARRGNLEDWGMLLASVSPVRKHVERELADVGSGVWDLFDPAALEAALPSLGGARRGAREACVEHIERGAKRAAHAALQLAPSVERAMHIRSCHIGLRIDQLCLRVMVLKAWHDLFVRGDGSRRALEEKLARVQ